MLQGILFIFYILVISGLVAMVGDRVGHRIGKKKLTWFNLRPRHTAVLVTVLTGLMISSLTTGALLLLSQNLRNALFNYTQTIAFYESQTIQARVNLDQVKAELSEAEDQRGAAQSRLYTLTKQLNELKQELETQQQQQAARLATAQQNLSDTQQQLDQAQKQLTQIQAEAQTARQQVTDLQTQQKELEVAKQALQLDRDQLERSLAASQAALTTLQEQKSLLDEEIQYLNQMAVRLRRGELGILAGEILAVGVIDSSGDATNLQQQLDTILAAAEQRARQLGATPSPPAPTAVQIRKNEVEEILTQVRGSGSWVVRIVSVSNRLVGENVPVIADINPNKRIFDKGSVLATAVIQPGQDAETLQNQLLGLLSAANLRSQEAGLLSNPLTGTVGEFSQVKLLETVQQLQLIQTSTDVKVVTESEIYTAGPLSVSFELPSDTITGQIPNTP